MFTSLVVVFPATHEGGSLILCERKEEWTFDANEMLARSTSAAPAIAYVAFYSDTEHEVLPVASGARVTLTNSSTIPSFCPVADALGSIKRDLNQKYSNRHDHAPGYVVPEPPQYLKRSDALVFSARMELDLVVLIKIIILYIDKESQGVYLGSTTMKDCYHEVHDSATLFHGMDVMRRPQIRWSRRVKDPNGDAEDKKTAILWVTPLH